MTRALSASRSFMALGGGAFVSACTVIGPDYEAPSPDAFASEGFVYDAGYSTDEPLAEWWTAFDDPTLDRLVALGLEENRTLTVAAANLRAARAAFGLARQNRLPFDQVTASYQETRQAAVFFAGTGIDGGDEPADREPNENVDFLDVGLGANWELDLFGRVTRLIEVADAQQGAAEAALNDLRAVVIADIADAYVALRGLQAQLAVARRNAANQARTLELVRERRRAGRVTDLDVDQARAQLATTEAFIPPIEADIAEVSNQLAVLVGRPPADIATLVSGDAPLPAISGPLTVGDPARLLRRRPDIAQTERVLASATAEIGLNISEAFPRVDFVGDVGFRTVGLENLFAANALNFAFGPQISWSVTDLARARQNVRVADAAAQAAFANYEQTVLLALSETESALVRQTKLQERAVSLAEAQEASASAAELARIRYDAGASDFLNVLDAERVELQSANDLAAVRTEISRAQVAVFRALRAGAAPLEASAERRAEAQEPFSP